MNQNAIRPLRLARVASSPFTFRALLLDQVAAIRDSGIEVTLVSGDGKGLSRVASELDVPFCSVPMNREPAPVQDIRSLARLTRVLRDGHFDIVHSSTPKAGLLSALAGVFSRIPIRLHTFTGQRWQTLSGVARLGLKGCDRLIGSLSTQTYADSSSQRDFLVNDGVVKPRKISVLAQGSISGVNLQRFGSSASREDSRRQVREELGISQEALLIVFVGRLTRDKGLVELVEAFQGLAEGHRLLHLLLVGPLEPALDPLPPSTLSTIEAHIRIHCTGFSPSPERFLGASDILCLPSYREGFGTAVIEAAAMGLPAVATEITGLSDAVVNEVTGLLVPPRTTGALAAALQRLIDQPELRLRLGARALERAIAKFDSRKVNNAVVEEYLRLAKELPGR